MADVPTTSSSIFTPKEEEIIQNAVNTGVQQLQDQARQDLVATEIRNRILDAQHEQPGYKY